MTKPGGPAKQYPIVPRKLKLDLGEEIPRHWCDGSAFMTHMLNTYTLLVPDNESYYIRQLDRCSDEISDPALLSNLHLFCRQEAQHGIGHRAYWRKLDEQGLRYRGFVTAVGWFNYKLLEPILPRGVHLANIACIEHINANLGSFYLQRDLLANSDPKLRLLFYWHFAEEIEHKSVAFDVFDHLYGSYLLRMMGALTVFPLFYMLNTAGTVVLLWQDGQFFKKATCRDCYDFLFRQGAVKHALRNFWAYLKPGFHPSHLDESGLIGDFFANADNNRHFRDFPA